jgi:hypothetical protein
MMGSYPELFWQATPEMSLEIQSVRSTISPLIILGLLWLATKLVTNKNFQVLLKLFHR